MAFSYVGGAENNGDSDTPDVDHGQSISDGDFVVMYVVSNSTSAISANADSGGTWFEIFDEQPSPESARHAMYYKEATNSEPSNYSATAGNAEWGCMVTVWTKSAVAEIDAAFNTARTTGKDQTVTITACNGETVSDGALSVVGGGKDNRVGAITFTGADNSYTGVHGSTAEEEHVMAHRIFATGTTISFDVLISPDGISDNSFSGHVSFVEQAAAAPFLPFYPKRDNVLLRM